MFILQNTFKHKLNHFKGMNGHGTKGILLPWERGFIVC